jgi:hypothetical protein
LIALAMAVQAFAADVTQDIEDEEFRFLAPQIVDQGDGSVSISRAPAPRGHRVS